MIAVDTNVLVRALADDPAAPDQCVRAREVIASAGRVRVSSIVFVETLWVLHRHYGAAREHVAEVAAQLLSHPRYGVEGAAELEAALAIFAAENVEFADALALADARAVGCPLCTFDRKLAKLRGVELVSA